MTFEIKVRDVKFSHIEAHTDLEEELSSSHWRVTIQFKRPKKAALRFDMSVIYEGSLTDESKEQVIETLENDQKVLANFSIVAVADVELINLSSEALDFESNAREEDWHKIRQVVSQTVHGQVVAIVRALGGAMQAPDLRLPVSLPTLPERKLD